MSVVYARVESSDVDEMLEAPRSEQLARGDRTLRGGYGETSQGGAADEDLHHDEEENSQTVWVLFRGLIHVTSEIASESIRWIVSVI